MTTRKTTTARQVSGRKSLSLTKHTLKDLAARREGPRGGFIMRDTVIVRTSP